ncbi:hypothetical protein D3C71_2203310 [compost metagenome]
MFCHQYSASRRSPSSKPPVTVEYIGIWLARGAMSRKASTNCSAMTFIAGEWKA